MVAWRWALPSSPTPAAAYAVSGLDCAATGSLSWLERSSAGQRARCRNQCRTSHQLRCPNCSLNSDSTMGSRIRRRISCRGVLRSRILCTALSHSTKQTPKTLLYHPTSAADQQVTANNRWIAEAKDEDHPALPYWERIIHIFIVGFGVEYVPYAILRQVAIFGSVDSDICQTERHLEESMVALMETILTAGGNMLPRPAALYLREVLLPLYADCCRCIRDGADRDAVIDRFSFFVKNILRHLR